VETPEGTWLGIVRELVRAGENDVLVIADASGRERLLPMLESVVKFVDVGAGRIVAVPQEEAG
jgi:ribosomal 30S subunit maturation factor RimM